MNTGRSRLKLSNQEPLAEASRTLNLLRTLHRKGPPTSTILKALASMAIVMEWLDAQLQAEAKVATMVSVVPTLVTKERSVADQSQMLSLGQSRVRASFNPGGHPKVNELKQLAAEFIDLCNHLQNPNADGEERRLWALAMTHAEDAAMWAVKAATTGT